MSSEVFDLYEEHQKNVNKLHNIHSSESSLTEIPDDVKLLLTVKIMSLILITGLTFFFGLLPLIW
jgi:hypothetical protein